MTTVINSEGKKAADRKVYMTKNVAEDAIAAMRRASFAVVQFKEMRYELYNKIIYRINLLHFTGGSQVEIDFLLECKDILSNSAKHINS